MKTYILIIFCSALLFTSCGNKESKNEKQEPAEEIVKSDDDSDFKEAKNCDEFIDQYEEWMDNYLVLLEKYMKNPMDSKLMEDYMKLAEESMFWLEQWSGKLAVCASKDKYEKRFDEITERAEKKMKELGIE